MISSGLTGSVSADSTTIDVHANVSEADWFADNYWTPTGVFIRAGANVTVSATGTWTHHPTQSYDADGADEMPNSVCYPGFVNGIPQIEQEAQVGQLIGRIIPGTVYSNPSATTSATGTAQLYMDSACVSGDGDPPWAPILLGVNTVFTAMESGYLQLTINDDTLSGPIGPTTRFADNSGTLSVTVSVKFASEFPDLRWAELSPTGSPTAVADAASALDPATGDLYLFGGHDGGDETTEFQRYSPPSDLTADGVWTNFDIDSIPHPIKRGSAVGLWDDIEYRMLIWGGNPCFGGCRSDLWSYTPESDGSLGTFELVSDAGSIRGRAGGAGIWDPENQRLYLYGGSDGFGSQTDQFIYFDANPVSSTSQQWIEVAPVDVAETGTPGARGSAASTWDPENQRIIIFGGVTDTGVLTGVLNDLWAFDPSESVWTQLDPGGASTSTPAARWSATGAWDPKAERFVLFGGNLGFGLFESDVWAYYLGQGQWRLEHGGSVIPAPIARQFHMAEWDQQRDRMLLFGGGQPTRLNDTWELKPLSTKRKIVYNSDRDRNLEIYLMNEDGSGQTRLTDNSAADLRPNLSPDGRRIVFNSNRDGNEEIYVMNVDGSGQTRLTFESAPDLSPQWSHDGNWIVFQSDRDVNEEIYAMRPDGSDQHAVLPHPANDAAPEWSPDGTQLAFQSQVGGGFWNIWVMDIDPLTAVGSNRQPRTTNVDQNFQPDWSHDGTKIAFQSNRSGDFEIYVMDANGSNQDRLTTGGRPNQAPTWSPDDTQIAFHSERDGNGQIYVLNVSNPLDQTNISMNEFGDGLADWGSVPVLPLPGTIAFDSDRGSDFDPYVMDPDGSDQTEIIFDGETEFWVRISPGGSKIAFMSDLNGDFDIYTMNLDGSDLRQRTATPYLDDHPNWSPDGTRIAFSSLRTGNWEVFVMDSEDDGNLINVSNHPDEDCSPSWSPDGELLAFHSRRDGDLEIVTVDPDDISEPVFLTNNNTHDWDPEWSPDGTKIAFYAERDGNQEIYVMDSGGETVTNPAENLSNHPDASDQAP